MALLSSAEAGLEREALVRLSVIPGVGRVRLRRGVQAAGSARALLALSERARARRLGVPAAQPGRADEARSLLARYRTGEARVVCWAERDYPSRLHHLADPPPLLFVRGNPARLQERQVAIVGSRAATRYGLRVAGNLGRALARAGVTVLSGLALGIDGAAQSAAVMAGGVATAVLGSGLERAQPRSHEKLYRDLLRDGAAASEYPPGTRAQPRFFPERNRLIAALSHVVVVVEASERSGALITATQAAELGREVLAVPGPIDSPRSRGVNALIRDGARPVLGATTVLETLGVAEGGSDGRSAADPQLPVAMGPDAEAAWAALETEARSVDELAVGAGLEAGRALAALTRLELGGWVRRDGGLRFRRSAG